MFKRILKRGIGWRTFAVIILALILGFIFLAIVWRLKVVAP